MLNIAALYNIHDINVPLNTLPLLYLQVVSTYQDKHISIVSKLLTKLELSS